MHFPVTITFKILTLAPKLYVTDAGGQSVGFVRQKLFAFREAVTVFADETVAIELYKINADRIIDWSANYHLTNVAGHEVGTIRRRGARSLWRAHYEVYIGERQIFEIREASALVRFVDLVIGEIPLIGLFTGYFLNPVYNVTRSDEALALKIVKHRSFLESRVLVEKLADISPEEQECVLLSIMMMVLLERRRG